MTEKELATLASWIANIGLEGAGETALVEGFCGRAVAAGLPLARAIVFIDTLHPIHEGRVFRWERDKPAATVSEYGRSTEGEAAERWRRSPHYRVGNCRIADAPARHARNGARVRALSGIVGGGDYRVCGGC